MASTNVWMPHSISRSIAQDKDITLIIGNYDMYNLVEFEGNLLRMFLHVMKFLYKHK